MTVKEESRRAHDANVAAWRALAAVTGCEVIDEGGLFTYFSLAPTPNFNPTIVCEPNGDPDAALASRHRAYEQAGIPFGFEVPAGLDPGIEDAARRRGMTLHAEPSTMVLRPVPSLERIESDIRRIGTGDLEDYLLTQAEGFGDSLAALQTFMPPAVLETSSAFLGFVEGVPAATSMVVVTGAEAGVFGVATRPAFRRRGLGRALTEAAVGAAREAGAELVWLHASEMGRSVYERMGFRVVGSMRIWVDRQS